MTRWGGAPPKAPPIRCRGSIVQNVTNLVIRKFAHAGIITHKCTFEESDHLTCECDCGLRWLKPFKGVRPT